MTAVLVFILRLALAGVLYAFLGWGLYTLWQDIARARRQEAAQRVAMLRLEQQQGEAVVSFQARAPVVVIGRDPACEWALTGPTLSARHARLSFHDAQWWVEDLNSTNGTYLNDERLHAPTALTHLDRLRCGGVELTVYLRE
jgi:pSer/pThr/pTyr-binding forkhead associated (FHA) protein